MSKITFLTLTNILLYIGIPLYLLPINIKYRFIILNAFWIYFLVNMILQKKVGIGIEKFEKYPGKFSLSTFAKNHILLFVLILINFGIHIYPIVSRTILIRYDEPTLVQSGLGLFTRISSQFEKFLNIEFLTFTRIFYFVLIVALIVFRKKIRTFGKHVVNYFNDHGIAKTVFFLLLILLSCIYFVIIRNTSFHGSLVRYPPMSKFLYFITYTIFGIEEFAPRLVQVLLGSIGIIYLYRTILLYYEKRAALLGVLIFMFNPLVSYHFNYAELGIGTISFTIITSFYFIRFLKYRYDNDLLITFFLIGIGFLYKRSILLMLIIVPVYLLVFNFKYAKRNFTRILKLIWLSLIPILPFLIIGKFLSTFYIMDLSRLFNKWLYSYFIHLGTQISWVMFFLFLLSIIFVVYKELNKLCTFMLLLFAGFYLLYTIYPWNYVDRFSMAFIPTIAIVISIFIYKVFHRKKFILNTIIVLTGIYLISISTFTQLPEIQPQFMVYKNYLLEHHPTDVALKWIKKNLKNKNILSLHVSGIAFYRDKLNFKKSKIFSMSVKEFNESSRDDIERFLIENSISCILTSNAREPCKKDNIDPGKFTSIKEFKYNNGNKISLYIASGIK